MTAKEDAAAAADKKPGFLNRAGKPVFFEENSVCAVESSSHDGMTILHLKSGQSLELQGKAEDIAKQFFDA